MSRYRPVADAIKRRVDAGLCPICGGELVPVPHLVRDPKGVVCVNNDDGRHGGRGRRIRLK